jgi:hypothetical protein
MASFETQRYDRHPGNDRGKGERMKPQRMTEVIAGKRYNTNTGLLIAGDDYWDGQNWERRGRNIFLYKTKQGNYFSVAVTKWQGERDLIHPITQEEAISLWESLPNRRVEFEEAFPGVTVEDGGYKQFVEVS